jgi:glutathione peroxidase
MFPASHLRRVPGTREGLRAEFVVPGVAPAVVRAAARRWAAAAGLATVMAAWLGGVGLAAAGTPTRPAAGAAAPAGSMTVTDTCPPILDRRMPRLQDDAPQHLCQFAGRVVLVVNTASYCGFTRQYEGLEELYRRYRDRGLVILGFPSNDFSQEPGSSKEIADLCFNTYGIMFPMFAKTSVTGPQADPLFVELARQAGAPKWNFYKYLIGRDGKVLGSYSSMTGPLDARLTRDVDQALRR